MADNPYAAIDAEGQQGGGEGGGSTTEPINPYAALDTHASEAAKSRASMEGHRQRVKNDERVRPQIEHKDAPTIFDLPIPGLKGMPGRKEGDEGVSLGSKLALQFGPLSTDNPKSRQDIVLEHLPGAEKTEDKFGNPGITYKGKFYYTSRPGEIDKMDVGRGTGMAAIAAPAAALSGISIPLGVVTGGLLNGAQSIIEGLVTRASGGKPESEPLVDFPKAGTATALGAISPLIGPALRPAASALYRQGARFVPMFHGSGTPTGRGLRILEGAGFTQEQIAAFTPEIRENIQNQVNRNFGSPETAASAYRESLGTEFGMPQTRGEISGDPAHLYKERRLRGGSYGEGPQTTMQDQVAERTAALNTQQEALRSRAGGGGPALTAGEAGEQTAAAQRTLSRDYQANTVRPAYAAATDEAAVTAAGGTRRADVSAFQQLPNIAAQALDAPGPGRLIVNDTIANIAPHTADMMQQLRTWARPGLGGNFPQTLTQVSWDAVDKMRQQLRQSYEAAAEAAASGRGTRVDVDAARRVMDAFDSQFTQNNPLLRNARALAEGGIRMFRPQDDQAPLTQSLLEKFNRPASSLPGQEVMDAMFGPSGIKTGKGLDTVQHMVSLHPPGTPGHLAMAQESLRRLMADPDNSRVALSPAKIASNIDDALGDRQGAAYHLLLNPDQIAELSRFRDLMRNYAESGRLVNPSGSGHEAVAAGRSGAQKLTGAAIGAWIGKIMGEGGKLVGAAAGAAGAKATGGYTAQVAADRAVGPAAGTVYNKSYTPFAAGGAAAVPAAREGLTDDQGHLSTTPIERIWNGLLGR